MATLNYAFKEITCKIVYYGCGLCGKTTNLIHVHKTVPGKFRGELVSLATEQDRTLFFDFLPLDLGEVKGFKTKFQLYTVPGQVYYNATRKLVLRGVDGLVFVVDSQKDRLQENMESYENLRQNLAEYGYHLQTQRDDADGIPWVLQLNKRDMPQIATKEEILEAMGLAGADIVSVDAVAVTGGGVKETLKGISSLVIQKLNTTGSMAPQRPAGATPAPVPQTSRDDEYEEVSESDLSDEALERPQAPARPAAPPRPVGPPMEPPTVRVPPSVHAPRPSAPVRPAPPQQRPASAPIPAVEPAVASTTPTISVAQLSDARWRGMKTGSGSLSMTLIPGSTEYQLSGIIAFTFAKRLFNHKMVVKGTDRKVYEGQEIEYTLMESAPGQTGPFLQAWVAPGPIPSMFLQYTGFGGEIQVLPVGKKVMP